MKHSKFENLIWDYYKKNRRDFPWRNTTNPYHIFVSEVMLQQTQTVRVIEKYNTFIKELPTIQDLARVQASRLLLLWQGLGYNRRALYLQRSAQIIVQQYNGLVPHDPDILVTLPGIGPNTAASIIVFSFNIPLTFIETNIRRVFIHEFFNDQTEIHDKQILPLVEQTIDQQNPREWYYALMDYGSHLPKLVTNPNRRSKHYTKQSKFEGSLRQVRGAILREVLLNPRITKEHLQSKIQTSNEYFAKALHQLEKEGFITITNNQITFTDK